jgi:hypothetical protein
MQTNRNDLGSRYPTVKNSTTLMLLLLIVALSGVSPARGLPDGPYFGEDPPGRTPKIFAKGFISKKGGLELYPRFSPDGTEFLYMTAGKGDSSEQARFQTIHLIRESDEWRISDIRGLTGRDDASGVQYSPG